MGHPFGGRQVSRRAARQGRAWPSTGAGFTLVEIMVVVAIIGIVLAIVMLRIASGGRDDELETEGKRTLALLTYAREQAELQTREYGLYCGEAGYEFLKFDPRTGIWRTVEEDESLRARKLPEGLKLGLVVEGRPVVLRRPVAEKPEERLPHIMIFSNGDLTPFELTLYREGVSGGHVLIRSTVEGTIEAPPVEGRA